MTKILEEIKQFNFSDDLGDDTFLVYTLGEAKGNGRFAYLGVKISCADLMIDTQIYLSDDLDDLYAKIPEYWKPSEV